MRTVPDPDRVSLALAEVVASGVAEGVGVKTTTQLQSELHELDQQRSCLYQQLEVARRREAIRAEATRKKRQIAKEVLARLDQGEWVAGTARLWWCREGAGPVRRADADELEILDALVRAGVVERGVVGR